MLKFFKKIISFFLVYSKKRLTFEEVIQQNEKTQKMIIDLFVVLKAIRNDINSIPINEKTEFVNNCVGFNVKNGVTAAVTYESKVKTDIETNIKTDFE